MGNCEICLTPDIYHYLETACKWYAENWSV